MCEMRSQSHLSSICDLNCTKPNIVYFHQNTKEVFKEFPKTKDAKTLKQHQRFFLGCIVVIIIDDINVKVISITRIGLGWAFQFLVLISGIPIGSGIPILCSIPKIPVGFFFLIPLLKN
jgi:hypothetical protein